MGLVLGGCGGATGAPSGVEGAGAVDADVQRRIAGVWRLIGFTPAQQLSPAFLLGLRTGVVMVRFERGRMTSASTALSFDRPYRIANAHGDRFTLFVEDDAGVEYESACQLDHGGRLLFQSLTAPWGGHGVLKRDGVASSQTP